VKGRKIPILMSLARDKQNKQRIDPRRSDVFILVSFDRVFLEKRKVNSRTCRTIGQLKYME